MKLAIYSSHPSRSGLAGNKLLMLENGHCLRDQALSFFQVDANEETHFRTSILETLRTMVAAGSGIHIAVFARHDATA
jgi:LysR family hydrogen peroxide-inducible transcriptional activator